MTGKCREYDGKYTNRPLALAMNIIPVSSSHNSHLVCINRALLIGVVVSCQTFMLEDVVPFHSRKIALARCGKEYSA